MEVYIDGVKYVPETVTEPDHKLYTVTDVYERYLGTQEYNGIVATIQKWYYGTIIHDSWCATSMCWALAQLGIREYTLQGKYENVYYMCDALWKAASAGRCREIVDVNQMIRGDIIIFAWDKNFSPTSSKHITSFVEFAKDGVKCLGGNQKDGINYAVYDSNKIEAIFRPDYAVGNIKNLEHLPNG